MIVAFGDSLTYGTGAAEHESYPAVLAQLIGAMWCATGTGEVTEQGCSDCRRVWTSTNKTGIIVSAAMTVAPSEPGGNRG